MTKSSEAKLKDPDEDVVQAAIEYFLDPLIHEKYVKLKRAVENHPDWNDRHKRKLK